MVLRAEPFKSERDKINDMYAQKAFILDNIIILVYNNGYKMKKEMI